MKAKITSKITQVVKNLPVQKEREQMADAMWVHYETWQKWKRGQRQPDKAAQQLMQLLLWLHQHRAATLARWLSET